MRRECGERFPRHWLQRKTLVSDPGIHHGTCTTHVPWCMWASLTRGGGENVPGIPGACATRNVTYLGRGPLSLHLSRNYSMLTHIFRCTSVISNIICHIWDLYRSYRGIFYLYCCRLNVPFPVSIYIAESSRRDTKSNFRGDFVKLDGRHFTLSLAKVAPFRRSDVL